MKPLEASLGASKRVVCQPNTLTKYRNSSAKSKLWLVSSKMKKRGETLLGRSLWPDWEKVDKWVDGGTRRSAGASAFKAQIPVLSLHKSCVKLVIPYEE